VKGGMDFIKNQWARPNAQKIYKRTLDQKKKKKFNQKKKKRKEIQQRMSSCHTN
jgi:hypothetical protein